MLGPVLMLYPKRIIIKNLLIMKEAVPNMQGTWCPTPTQTNKCHQAHAVLEECRERRSQLSCSRATRTTRPKRTRPCWTNRYTGPTRCTWSLRHLTNMQGTWCPTPHPNLHLLEQQRKSAEAIKKRMGKRRAMGTDAPPPLSKKQTA